jgi:phosphopantetheinyl transferase
MLVERSRGVKLCPADVHISNDERGRPVASGAWTDNLGIHPVVSISHIPSAAAAVAALDSSRLVGIDIEELARAPRDLADLSLSTSEMELLGSASAEVRQEWGLRFWCAREAVFKALGREMAAGPHALEVCDIDQHTGGVSVASRNGAAGAAPRSVVKASSGRQGRLVYSAVITTQKTEA